MQKMIQDERRIAPEIFEGKIRTTICYLMVGLLLTKETVVLKENLAELGDDHHSDDDFLNLSQHMVEKIT